jgi:hypothetical protein
VRKQWDKASNGPDWTDIAVTMRAIEQLHDVTLTIALVCGVFEGPALYVTISAFKGGKDASVLGTPVICLSGEYPCKDHREIEGCLYAALLEMDFALTKKLWNQLDLPFTAEDRSA